MAIGEHFLHAMHHLYFMQVTELMIIRNRALLLYYTIPILAVAIDKNTLRNERLSVNDLAKKLKQNVSPMIFFMNKSGSTMVDLLTSQTQRARSAIVHQVHSMRSERATLRKSTKMVEFKENRKVWQTLRYTFYGIPQKEKN